MGGENGFQTGDVWLGGGRPRASGKFFDPDLALELRRGIWNRLRRRAGFGFGRRNFDPKFVSDVEVIEAGLKPEGVGQRLFVPFEERKEVFRGGADGGEVDDIFALEFLLDISE